MKLFEVFGEVKIDDKGATKKLSGISDKAKKLGSGFADVSKKAGKFALGFGAAATAAGGAMFAFADKTTQSLDRVDKLSQRMGMSKKEFQQWDYVLGQNGVSIDQMQSGMKTLSQRMQQAAEGTGKGAENFEKLGISVRHADGTMKTQYETYEDTIKALQSMEDGTEKAALAQEMFGRTGQEILPLINGTTEGMEKLKQKALDTGMVMSDDAVAAGAAFQDNLDDTKKMLGGVATKIGVTLLPMFNNMMQWVQDHMPQIQAVFSAVIDNVAPKVQHFYVLFKENVLPILQNLFGWVQENMPTFEKIFKVVFDATWTVIKSVWKVLDTLLIPILKVLFNWVSENMDTIGAVVGGVFEGIGAVVEAVTDTIVGIVDAFKTAYEWAGKFLKKSGEASKERAKQVEGGWTDIKGMRANGGPISAGDAYIVGEKEAEVFVSDRDGQIFNQSQLAGMGGGISMDINIGEMTVREESDIEKIASIIYDKLQAQLGTSRNSVMDDFRREARL